MENKTKQSATEAAGYAAGVSFGVFGAVFRGKHMSAAVIILAGAVLLLGGAFIRHGQTSAFVQIVGTVLIVVGLIGWVFSTSKK